MLLVVQELLNISVPFRPYLMTKLHLLPHCHHHHHLYRAHPVLALKLHRCKEHCLWQLVVLSNSIEEPTMYVAVLCLCKKTSLKFIFFGDYITP